MVSKRKYLKSAGIKTKVSVWLVVLTMVLTVALMGYGAYAGVRTSLFDMPLTKIGPVGEAVEEVDTLVEELDEKWGDKTEEDSAIEFDLAQAVADMKKEANLLNAVATAEASQRVALELIAEASELAEAWGSDTEEFDAAKQQAEDTMGNMVKGLKALVVVVWIAFAVPAVLALLGGLFKVDLLNLLALLIGMALTYLIHGLPLTIAVAVVLIAQFVMTHGINRSYRRYRRDMKNI